MSIVKIPLFVFIILVATISYGQLDSTEKKLVDWIDDNNEEAELFLKKLVNINSGTMNFEGVRKVGDELREKFDALGMETIWIRGDEFNRAGHLVAKTKRGSGSKIMMIGHLDTVFPKDSPNQEWIKIDENTAKGPGIADMKGGDVVILQSLAALHSAGLLEKMNIWVVMTGDEEKSGRPLSKSKAELVKAAKWADISLGYENGDGDPATAIVARRSSSGWTLTTTGTAAHSSQIFKPIIGAGAINEASRILYQFYQELSQEEFLTFSPGVIVGGTTVTYDGSENAGTAFGKNNVVSKEVTVTGDIRCISPEQLESTRKKMREIVANHLPNTDASIEFGDGYPPFALADGNYVLLEKFSQISEDLGFGKVDAVNPLDAGAADISFTSEFVEMGLGGLGMSGANDHTIRETGDLRGLPIQTKRSAILLYRLWKGD